MFGEKNKEYDSASKQEIDVWKSPKYEESKKAALKLIADKEYITEGDFWILMNRTKSGKMAYTGLIISHNGCLKINDNAPVDQRFHPECVSVNESGYGGALIYTYVCPEQGLYEVGEVTPKNCKNDYPYAMALKRCFDRVVLKLCKLAFYGIYSDSEADEFKENHDAPTKAQQQKDAKKADEINSGFNPGNVAMATSDQVENLIKGCAATGTDAAAITKHYNVEAFKDLTELQAKEALARLNSKANRRATA